MSQPTLLLVDDEAEILNTLKRQLRKTPFSITTAHNGEEAIKHCQSNTFDIVISDMRMPGIDGAAVLTHVATESPQTVRILLTGYSDTESAQKAINDGKIFSYQTKPWDGEALIAHLKQAWQFKQSNDERIRLEAVTAEQNQALATMNKLLEERVEARTASLEQANEALRKNLINTVLSLSSFIERYEALSHQTSSKLLAEQAKRLGQALSLSRDEVNDIYIAGLLQNIGLLGMNDRVKSKQLDTMTDSEKNNYLKHTIYGESFLMKMQNMDRVSEYIRHHHEKLDGSGFPDQLSGEAISQGAQILSLLSDFADLCDGITTGETMPGEQAIAYLRAHCTQQHDSHHIDLLVETMSDTPCTQEQAVHALSTDQLRVNMILSQDLKTTHGVFLLSKDTLLTERLIRKLKKFEQDDKSPMTIHVYSHSSNQKE